MKIVRFCVPGFSYEAIGYLEGETVIDFSRGMRAFRATFPQRHRASSSEFFSIQAMLSEEGLFAPELFRNVREYIADHGLEEDLTIPEPKLLAPLARPPRIIALGLNYAAHAAETGKKPPKQPIFFIKASTAVIGPEESVVCPKGVGRIDHEVELAAIVGKGGRNITRKKAPRHIAGYTILNDVTARDMQAADMAASRPWFLSKSFDTFAPMGPWIETEADGDALGIRLTLNGEVMQDSNTSDMIFSCAYLVSYLSRCMTLYAGSAIFTGTPPGVGFARTPPVFLRDGDTVVVEIASIGSLTNPVRRWDA